MHVHVIHTVDVSDEDPCRIHPARGQQGKLVEAGHGTESDVPLPLGRLGLPNNVVVQSLQLLAGLVLIIAGARGFVDGITGISGTLGLSPLFLSLAIVPFATELPEKLFLAKARKLGEKGKLAGCTRCTCRGGYHTPRECHANRCCCSPEYDWRTHPEYDPSWEADQPVPRDPEALPKAIAAITALSGLPSVPPALRPFDLSNPTRLVYPPGYVKPMPPEFALRSLGLP